MFDIDLMSRTPIYEQLYNKTVELIIKGVLKENSQLPSIRALSKELGVNPNTVVKAYNQLEHDGIIYSLTGRGSFVAKVSDDTTKRSMFLAFDECVQKALNTGITKDELIHRIEEMNKND
jgi:GntR family transcriptional regulator